MPDGRPVGPTWPVAERLLGLSNSHLGGLGGAQETLHNSSCSSSMRDMQHATKYHTESKLFNLCQMNRQYLLYVLNYFWSLIRKPLEILLHSTVVYPSQERIRQLLTEFKRIAHPASSFLIVQGPSTSDYEQSAIHPVPTSHQATTTTCCCCHHCCCSCHHQQQHYLYTAAAAAAVSGSSTAS